MEKVIIRADRAGVFYGEIAERRGSEVDMINVRRLWYWDGAIYEVCQHCNYIYNCSRWMDGRVKFIDTHKYCPSCGLKMSLYNRHEIYKQQEENGEFILME